MAVVTLPCGCTLDSDFVETEHQQAPPFHRTRALEKPAPLPPSSEEDVPKEEKRPKKK